MSALKEIKPTVIEELKRSRRRTILPAFSLESCNAYTQIHHHGSITNEDFKALVRIEVSPYCAGLGGGGGSGVGPRSALEHPVIEKRS